jgi:uracil-DNA glycosylase
MTHDLQRRLLPSWACLLAEEIQAPYFAELQTFIAAERRSHTVYPPEEEVFTAFALTPFDNIRVVLLGQDPYHDEGQAHGLCFSVVPGVPPPPSLLNIFRELRDDLGFPVPNHGCLVPWAKQGVLLLNVVLTVRAHEPHSHRGKGWEQFTDAVIRKVNEKRDRVVLMLWGGPAQQKRKLIDPDRHTVVTAAHPSPLSAHRGFFGSRPFSTANRLLREGGQSEIDWRLPEDLPSLTVACRTDVIGK